MDGARDHDSIKVGRSEGGFRAIQLRISGGAINFERVIVRYGNGTQEQIPVRARIPDGGQTRVIDLPGERRLIQSVDLWYGKDSWRRRPKVSFYGLRRVQADCSTAIPEEHGKQDYLARFLGDFLFNVASNNFADGGAGTALLKTTSWAFTSLP